MTGRRNSEDAEEDEAETPPQSPTPVQSSLDQIEFILDELSSEIKSDVPTYQPPPEEPVGTKQFGVSVSEVTQRPNESAVPKMLQTMLSIIHTNGIHSRGSHFILSSSFSHLFFFLCCRYLPGCCAKEHFGRRCHSCQFRYYFSFLFFPSLC
jgi:hypothetical protein